MKSEDLSRQISYALGYDIFKNVTQYMDLDPKYFIMGVNDNHTGEMRMEKEQLRKMLMTYQRMARQKQMETMKQAAKTNRTKGSKFLEGNKLKEGVVTLPSGLQYKILEKGKGPLPKANDTVKCNYKGSLLDGTVFDSSFRRGKPAEFKVSGVIKGWVEALQLMPTGSRWELYVPADLAYGDQGAGEAIKPGQTLIFEVELIGIVG
ncbi:MAG: FKBP-type peptidyl-prolyl cis-trans isomerase [Desulfobacteraceae bacterium]|nr:FKBP-type peptidyl-prolyl cis-trans isomerase [Desulfobacteraceae bacterium]